MFQLPTGIGIVLLIILGTTLIRAALGFGNALLAMPLLIPLLGVRTAAPLVGLIGLAVSVMMLIGKWRRIDFLDSWRLVASTLTGLPLGLFFLTRAPEIYLRMVLGVILIMFGLFRLIDFPLPSFHRSGFVWTCGFLAGIFGGAYNANGPPVVLYGVMRNWSPEQFRATLQGYFLVTGAAIVLSQGLSGLWTQELITLLLVSLPAAALAVWVGRKIASLIPRKQFTRLVHLSLVMLGAVLLI